MIAIKGQLVKLLTGNDSAKVLSIVYQDQPEGGRGVQLDREIGGSRWWLENQLIQAE